VSVDTFHLAKLANDMVTAVRQRLSQQIKNRRGRLIDPAWANRRLLLRAGDRLTPAARARLCQRRLKATFRTDDPTDELGAAWGVKEQVRRLLACSTLADAQAERMRLDAYVAAASMPETDRLSAALEN
jgi:transposase